MANKGIQNNTFKQEQLPAPVPTPLPFEVLSSGHTTLKEGELQSPNFARRRKGWRVTSEGAFEANDGEFRGTFILGGVLITVSSIDDLQDTIDEVSSQGGGTVSLTPDTYYATANITIPSNVTLEGNGATIDFGGGAYQILIQGTDAYTTGTLAVNNDSTTVTGTGTTWTADMVGRKILIEEFWYIISARNSNTEIVLETAYRGSDVSGITYVIATTVDNTAVKNLTLQNSSVALLKAQYIDAMTIDGVYSYGGLIGFDFDDGGFMNFFNSVADFCGTGITMNNFHYNTMFNFNVLDSTSGGGLIMDKVQNTGVEIWACSNNTGDAVSLTNVNNCGFEDFGIAETTGIGIKFGTGCTDISFSDGTIFESSSDGIQITSSSLLQFSQITIRNSGGQGIELVSGNSDIAFAAIVVDSNTSDGIKLTATTDRISVVGSSVINNGGYGINIAASTCDNNQIIAPAFNNNSSGNINDGGTNTFISPQETTSFNSSVFSSIVGGEPTSWTDLDISSVIGAAQKMVLIKVENTGGTVKLYAFRTNGDTSENYDSSAANSAASVKIDGNSAGTCLVKSDTSGIIEWISNAATAGVTFGNTGADVDQGSGTTTFNNNGDFLIVNVNSTTNDITGMTYNGVAMTQIGSVYLTAWSGRYHYTFGLVNPAQGSNSIVTSGGANWQFEMISVSGVDQVTPTSAVTVTSDTTGANPSVSVTTTRDKAYVVALGQIEQAATAGSNTTLANNAGSANYIFRSTNAVSPAASFTINITAASGGWRLKAFAINPARTDVSVLSYW